MTLLLFAHHWALSSVLSLVCMQSLVDGYQCISIHANLSSVQMVDSTISEHKHSKDALYNIIHVLQCMKSI